LETIVKFLKEKNVNVNFDYKLYLTPLIIILAVETIAKLNPIDTLSWIFLSFPYFIFTYLIVLSSIMFITSISNSYIKGVSTTSIIYLILAIINSIKSNFLGSPFLPGDVSMIKNITSLLSFLNMKLVFLLLPVVIWFLVLICYGIVFTSKKIFKNKIALSTKKRIWILVVVTFFFYLICINYWFMYKFLPIINNNVHYSGSDYSKCGFIFSFAVNTRNAILPEPSDYVKENVENELSSYPVQEKENIKPNVIVIMSETFWDPTKLNGVKFSTDPIPTFRSLSKNYTNGYMVTPSFGGMTCNVEFEFLTGFSNKYLPEYSIPYMHYIKNRTDSLVNIFKDNDYKTVALHTYYKDFFNRDNVYPLLGFDDFVGITDLENPEHKGIYVSDNEFMNQVIKQYENKGDNKLFLFGITMQNHLPYTNDKYDSYDIDVSSDVLSENDLASVRAYAQGIHDADKSLEKLINYFSNIEEPTVIVFFGDHLPSLGNNNSIYDDLNYSKDLIDRYSTPYVIWSNYDTSREDVNVTSSNLLGNQLLNYIGMAKNSYFEFLDTVSEKIPAMRTDLIIDSNGNIITEPSDDIKNIELQYEKFQYYLLFDKYKEISYIFSAINKVKNFKL
jgi:phosphoglycerol transferase MdoB-like AlkP superfamily enzyme